LAHHPPGVVPPGGTHLLLDLHGCRRSDDLDYVKRVCTEAAVATGATVIGEHFHHFGDGCGVSGVVLLAESHLSIHTWPEHQFVSADVYVCGTCDAEKAFPVLVKGFEAVDHSTVLVNRAARMSFKVLKKKKLRKDEI